MAGAAARFRGNQAGTGEIPPLPDHPYPRPKLLRISLRTMPLEVRMLLTPPLAEFEPSEG